MIMQHVLRPALHVCEQTQGTCDNTSFGALRKNAKRVLPVASSGIWEFDCFLHVNHQCHCYMYMCIDRIKGEGRR